MDQHRSGRSKIVVAGLDFYPRRDRVGVQQKGFRTQVLVVVTTLLDAQQYPAREIAALFRRRWQAELNLRSLNIVLQMDHLRCKSPERVRNEFLMHLLDMHLSTEAWCDALLTTIATHAVDDRPDRYEPRVRKRRPKNYPLMRQPRDDYKRRAA